MAQFRSHYDGKRIKVGMHFKNPSLTEKQHGHDLNINSIVNRYYQGSYSPVNISTKTPKFAGVFKPNMFEESVQYVREVQNEFNSLPSNVRKRFDNDPNKMLNFISDSKNIDEAFKLGLLDEDKYNEYLATKQPVNNQSQVTEPLQNGTVTSGSVQS